MNTTMIVDSLVAVQHAILTHEAQIESLDRAIGDGDHFINVRRGCEVLVGMREEFPGLTPSQAFQKIGMKLLGTIGGATLAPAALSLRINSTAPLRLASFWSE